MTLPAAYFSFRQILEESALMFPELAPVVDHVAILAGARCSKTPQPKEASEALRAVLSDNDIDPSIADQLPYQRFFTA